MIDFKQEIKKVNNNGQVKTEDAIKIVGTAQSSLVNAVELIKEMKAHVGMVLGEKAEMFISGLNGIKFSSTDFWFERQVGEQ